MSVNSFILYTNQEIFYSIKTKLQTKFAAYFIALSTRKIAETQICMYSFFEFLFKSGKSVGKLVYEKLLQFYWNNNFLRIPCIEALRHWKHKLELSDFFNEIVDLLFLEEAYFT